MGMSAPRAGVWQLRRASKLFRFRIVFGCAAKPVAQGVHEVCAFFKFSRALRLALQRRYSPRTRQNQLRKSPARLQAQFTRLGDTWRDQEHQKFAQEFQQTMRVLTQFMRIADEHIPFLLRKAQRIEENLQQR